MKNVYERGKPPSVLLLCLDSCLGLTESPRDEEGHDDCQDGDDDSVHDKTDEVIAASEYLGDCGLDSLVPGESGDESERGGDKGREGLEQLNFEFG